MSKSTKFMSVEEMADYLGISRSKAYQLVNQSDFPTLRIGRRIVVSVDGLESWVNAQLADSTL